MTAPLDPVARKTGALALSTYRLTKRFGSFTALDAVSIEVRPGTVHALLGENGAGKSTLVKAIVGYHLPDDGAVLIDGREHAIGSPVVARQLGIGMVYQHFTVVPGMTVAENLLLAKGELPAVVNWRQVRRELQAFLDTTPFRLDLDARPADLSAGEKQKLEILKQLYLQPRLLILDEPTSVLTPQEADEVLGALRDRAHAGEVTVIMISHKFREVMEVADDVSVLRRGALMGSHRVADTTPALLGAEMMGQTKPASAEEAEPVKPADPAEAGAASEEATRPAAHLARPPVPDGAPRLRIEGLTVAGDRGEMAVQGLSLAVRPGEIVGVAGVSGNGQRELMEALVGQRERAAGAVWIGDERYLARRDQNQRLNVRSLPEEPLRNACVGDLSVAMNIGLRRFDQAPAARAGWLRSGVLREQARALIAAYKVKTQGENAPIRSLSGGNVQRAVLARELDGQVDVLLVSNPVFGLDFAAVAEIHARILAVRNQGGAVLLLSEDLDELLKLADRIVVMSEGRIVHECAAEQADRHVLGTFMGGHAHDHVNDHAPAPEGARDSARAARTQEAA
ncbi:ATP-binding cassette domain-containing protein [Aquabacterium fontiphilum]|jgi:simple sugar transport system ATP-binding protein|uniref:ABC transporter ATP-binding protein n=1 Tax=Aquabacterium fontiphilum TaxID=450365 RepID=UPI001376829F|nr:ABC transporter ATP-binding protein [Aquabacterium fontiphilum]NBD21200.1 ATP-binding cassette domain-containing protein [Aquabacterium fontiphilum]